MSFGVNGTEVLGLICFLEQNLKVPDFNDDPSDHLQTAASHRCLPPCSFLGLQQAIQMLKASCSLLMGEKVRSEPAPPCVVQGAWSPISRAARCVSAKLLFAVGKVKAALL